MEVNNVLEFKNKKSLNNDFWITKKINNLIWSELISDFIGWFLDFKNWKIDIDFLKFYKLNPEFSEWKKILVCERLVQGGEFKLLKIFSDYFWVDIFRVDSLSFEIGLKKLMLENDDSVDYDREFKYLNNTKSYKELKFNYWLTLDKSVCFEEYKNTLIMNNLENFKQRLQTNYQVVSQKLITNLDENTELLNKISLIISNSNIDRNIYIVSISTKNGLESMYFYPKKLNNINLYNDYDLFSDKNAFLELLAKKFELNSNYLNSSENVWVMLLKSSWNTFSPSNITEFKKAA